LDIQYFRILASTTLLYGAQRNDAHGRSRELPMFRSALRLALTVVLVTVAIPAGAEERAANGMAAPSEAVAQAWAKEAKEAAAINARRPSSKAVKALYGTYGVLQGLDMYSTVLARNRGASEVNPMMNTGYTQATAMKALMTAATIASVKAIEKKNKKAAIATMITMNAVSALVVANNFRNASRLK
jgi:hypothetical protein